LGLLDKALSSRKIHGQPIPRVGGIAIAGAFYAPLIGLLFVDSGVGRNFTSDGGRVLGLFVGGALIVALGIYDDLRGADARQKFAVQFAVAAMMYGFGFRIDVVTVPVLGTLQLGLAGFPLTVLWIAGVTNAVNLIDGLDGLAAGIAFVALVALFVLAAAHGDPLMMLYTAALAGAVLGFLFFNFNPASVFMGDTGSLFLGFVLATASVDTYRKSATAVTLLVPIVLLGLPIADTLLSIGRRALRGAPLFSADRGHIHHRLLARGLSQRQAVLVLYALACTLAMVALVLADASDGEALVTLTMLAVGSFAALRLLGFFDWTRLGSLLEQRRRNLELRFSIDRIGERLRDAGEPDALWASLVDVAPVLGAHQVALEVMPDDAGPVTYRTSAGELGSDLLRARFHVMAARPRAAVLELAWADGRASIDRDTEIAVELLCDHLAEALERIGSRPATG
jgi:UDP-GlcNAc:undecaprenyl-phosphate GlcNAc-1-phosphate transferase